MRKNINQLMLLVYKLLMLYLFAFQRRQLFRMKGTLSSSPNALAVP